MQAVGFATPPQGSRKQVQINNVFNVGLNKERGEKLGRSLIRYNIPILCSQIKSPEQYLDLPTQSILLRGITRIENKQAIFLRRDLTSTESRLLLSSATGTTRRRRQQQPTTQGAEQQGRSERKAATATGGAEADDEIQYDEHGNPVFPLNYQQQQQLKMQQYQERLQKLGLQDSIDRSLVLDENTNLENEATISDLHEMMRANFGSIQGLGAYGFDDSGRPPAAMQPAVLQDDLGGSSMVFTDDLVALNQDGFGQTRDDYWNAALFPGGIQETIPGTDAFAFGDESMFYDPLPGDVDVRLPEFHMQPQFQGTEALDQHEQAFDVNLELDQYDQRGSGYIRIEQPESSPEQPPRGRGGRQQQGAARAGRIGVTSRRAKYKHVEQDPEISIHDEFLAENINNPSAFTTQTRLEGDLENLQQQLRGQGVTVFSQAGFHPQLQRSRVPQCLQHNLSQLDEYIATCENHHKTIINRVRRAQRQQRSRTAGSTLDPGGQELEHAKVQQQYIKQLLEYLTQQRTLLLQQQLFSSPVGLQLGTNDPLMASSSLQSLTQGAIYHSLQAFAHRFDDVALQQQILNLTNAEFDKAARAAAQDSARNRTRHSSSVSGDHRGLTTDADADRDLTWGQLPFYDSDHELDIVRERRFSDTPGLGVHQDSGSDYDLHNISTGGRVGGGMDDETDPFRLTSDDFNLSLNMDDFQADTYGQPAGDELYAIDDGLIQTQEPEDSQFTTGSFPHAIVDGQRPLSTTVDLRLLSENALLFYSMVYRCFQLHRRKKAVTFLQVLEAEVPEVHRLAATSAAESFVHLLTLNNNHVIRLRQAESYDDIIISKGPQYAFLENEIRQRLPRGLLPEAFDAGYEPTATQTSDDEHQTIQQRGGSKPSQKRYRSSQSGGRGERLPSKRGDHMPTIGSGLSSISEISDYDDELGTYTQRRSGRHTVTQDSPASADESDIALLRAQKRQRRSSNRRHDQSARATPKGLSDESESDTFSTHVDVEEYQLSSQQTRRPRRGGRRSQ